MTYRVAPSSAGPILCALVLAAAAFLALWLSRTPAAELLFAGGGREVSAESAYGELPLAFEPNAGRAAGGRGLRLALGVGSCLHRLRRADAGTRRGQARRGNRPRARRRQRRRAALRSSDCPVLSTTCAATTAALADRIPTFERVRYPGAWPGIDLDYYGDQRRLEYDFRLAPGADPNRIAIRVAGTDDLRLAANGDLLIGAGTETIRQRAPVAYQPATSDAPRTPVRASFALFGNTVGFRLGSYDHHRPLVIDPVVLAYSTYLGGDAFDDGDGIAVDSSGAAYVTGDTFSTDFDTVGEIEGDSGSRDAFVSKLTPAGDALEYSTYLGGGGAGEDSGTAIAVDSSGAAYVTGSTGSSDFNTVGEIEGDSGGADAFVSKLTPAGDALEFSTYLGGDASDGADGIAVDSSGAAYVTGRTDSTDFNTVGEIEGDQPLQDAFVSKLSPAGDVLEYSTYLGGDAFDDGSGIAVDSSGAAYVTGRTDSSDFNTVGGSRPTRARATPSSPSSARPETRSLTRPTLAATEAMSARKSPSMAPAPPTSPASPPRPTSTRSARSRATRPASTPSSRSSARREARSPTRPTWAAAASISRLISPSIPPEPRTSPASPPRTTSILSARSRATRRAPTPSSRNSPRPGTR